MNIKKNNKIKQAWTFNRFFKKISNVISELMVMGTPMH